MDLYGRGLVDIAIDLIIGYIFCGQASSKVDMKVAAAGNGDSRTISMAKRKEILGRRFITKNALEVVARAEVICSGDKSTFSEYGTLVGPVPEE